MAQVLRDEEIEAILAAGKDNKRSRKRPLNSLTIDYETKLRKDAEKKLGNWRKQGVIDKDWKDLLNNCPLLISKFNLHLADPVQLPSSRVNAEPIQSVANNCERNYE